VNIANDIISSKKTSCFSNKGVLFAWLGILYINDEVRVVIMKTAE
jgi:hypothetical protein